MEIKTRFAIGDKVWAIHNGKAIKFEVDSIAIMRDKTVYCAYVDGLVAAEEKECFATKDGLITYITSDDE